MASLVLFDFDHTLYRRDSLLDFSKFHLGNQFYMGIFKLFPMLIGFKLGILTSENAKQRYFSYFFGGSSYGDFTASAAKFARQQMPKHLDKNLLEKLLGHVSAGHKVYIVTASMPEWIAPWSHQYGISVIGTEPEIENGKLTGNFATPNCKGIQKTIRIGQQIDLSQYDEIIVYGNGTGDREMLQLAKKASS
ncbi:MAG: haloacid dehalogenase-like hydrolase [Flavobacterium sp.]|nr:haloacid dehalogenase-like hydrolase [Flavobacterium sp.]